MRQMFIGQPASSFCLMPLYAVICWSYGIETILVLLITVMGASFDVFMLAALYGANRQLLNKIAFVCTWLFLAYCASAFLGWTLDFQGLHPGTIANFRAFGWTLVTVLAMTLLRASAYWNAPDDA